MATKLILFLLLPLEVLSQVANHQFSICLHTPLLLLVYYCLLQACCSPNFSQNYALCCSEPEDGNVHFPFFVLQHIKSLFSISLTMRCKHSYRHLNAHLTCEHTGPLQQSQPLLDNL